MGTESNSPSKTSALERIPTHRCKVCRAWWILYQGQPDKYPSHHPLHGATWSLGTNEQCGPCCDNVAMGDQIEPLTYSADDLRYLIAHGPEYFGARWREATSADIFVARNHHGRLHGE